MTRRAALFVLACACWASTAAAATGVAADGSMRLFCATSDGSRHPKKLTVEAPVLIDDFEGRASTRLIAGYDPLGRPGGFNGKIVAKVVLRHPDGSKTGLGKLSTVQNTANGVALREKAIAVAPAEGDVVEWRFAFKKFERLDADECFLLLGAVQPPSEGCGPYPDWSTSTYVLPYRPGPTLVVSQGNCALGSHRGDVRHAYDIAMPVGTEIVAARAGEVVAVDDSSPDGTGLFEHDNAVVIEQDDGKLASYVHIQQGGARVARGERVEQGQVIALSGNSGHTGDLPHLHFQVTACADRRQCPTEPVTFRNTKSNPNGLLLGVSYRARGD